MNDKIYFLFLFQFQYGAIKRPDKSPVLDHQECFNSNMVRLKAVANI